MLGSQNLISKFDMGLPKSRTQKSSKITKEFCHGSEWRNLFLLAKLLIFGVGYCSFGSRFRHANSTQEGRDPPRQQSSVLESEKKFNKNDKTDFHIFIINSPSPNQTEKSIKGAQNGAYGDSFTLCFQARFSKALTYQGELPLELNLSLSRLGNQSTQFSDNYLEQPIQKQFICCKIKQLALGLKHSRANIASVGFIILSH